MLCLAFPALLWHGFPCHAAPVATCRGHSVCASHQPLTISIKFLVGAASDNAALHAVLAAAEKEGCMLCAQPLRLSPEGAKE